MRPVDFYALVDGYENKKHEWQELMRQQTYILCSPYMPKGGSYHTFKNNWRFGWERNDVIIKQPTPEEIELIKKNHARILANKRK
jgi:hypothetical protein